MTNVLLGVCVGDALGAPLEFIRRLPTRDEIYDALAMKGGGIIGVAPGQITDDSELMICLYKSITEGKDAMILYRRWMNSHPIDIGTTCSRAFAGFDPTEESKSNGALMRCAPIGVLYADETNDFIAEHAFADAKRTHANRTIHLACACYCIAIATEIKGHDGVLSAHHWIKNQPGGEEVSSWFEAALDPLTDVICTRNIGLAQWGFTLAFWHLYHKTSFVDAMVDTMKRGGDTDTNCAIVGGLVATRETIPVDMIEAVLTSPSGRPGWLHPSKYFM